MNGFIRFGHRLSLGELICLMLAGAGRNLPKRAFAMRFEELMRTLPSNEQRAIYERYHRAMHRQVFGQLVIGSPILAVLILFPVALVMMARRLVEHAVDALRNPLDSFDDIAFAAGDDSASASSATAR